MAFDIRLGIPEMEAFWNDLAIRCQQGKLDKDEEKLFKKLVKTLKHLGGNPRHTGLASHEIDELTRKYGFKVFQSYLDNKTPAAGRIFWTYGPARNDITVLAIEPHPEDQKHGAYERIKLSRLPKRPEESLAKQRKPRKSTQFPRRSPGQRPRASRTRLGITSRPLLSIVKVASTMPSYNAVFQKQKVRSQRRPSVRFTHHTRVETSQNLRMHLLLIAWCLALSSITTLFLYATLSKSGDNLTKSTRPG